jgi:dTDP-4-amino-4,6-dideoxygalactose transaminase
MTQTRSSWLLTKLHKLRLLFLPYQFGCVEAHHYLTAAQMGTLLNSAKANTDGDYSDIRVEYEREFAAVVGKGYAVSFAAARMGFYAYMEALGIGPGDEVILTGFTCAVMPNAVLKRCAKPVFTDVDPSTFGSCAHAISSAITPQTRLIVAQHSFGIPCDISSIADLARSHGIPLLEDCAISLGSTIDGKAVGNWGDAAIFSTDHSKPINTLTGGIFYTQSATIFEKVAHIARKAPELSVSHQRGICRQIQFERRFFAPDRYPRGRLIATFLRVWQRVSRRQPMNFLADNDAPPAHIHERYPYPARLPIFLAQLGLFELARWPEQSERRRAVLDQYLKIAKATVAADIPTVYQDPRRRIVPLRYVFTNGRSEAITNALGQFFDNNWTWFRMPLVCASEGPQSLGYIAGSCPISEAIGNQIINIPCNIPSDWIHTAQKSMERALSSVAGAGDSNLG